jgi:hypothetical protein
MFVSLLGVSLFLCIIGSSPFFPGTSVAWGKQVAAMTCFQSLLQLALVLLAFGIQSCLSYLCRRENLSFQLTSSCAVHNSIGASGGIITAWDSKICSLLNSDEHTYSLSTEFRLDADGTVFTLTNVYAPTSRNDKATFLAELTSIAANISGPWMLIGDFNLTRSPEDKNEDLFNATYVGDMPKSPSSQYGLKAHEDIDPRGIRITNGAMR